MKLAPLTAILALGGCWWAKDLPHGEGWSPDEGAANGGCVGKSCSDDGSRAGSGGPTSGAAGAAGAGQCGPGGASGGGWQPAMGGAAGFGGAIGGASGFGGQSAAHRAVAGQSVAPAAEGTSHQLAVSSHHFRLAPWSDADPSATLDAALTRGTEGIVGSWRGVVTTPWTSPYEVSVTFRADGTYSARCAWSSNVCCEAFYYGTDDDTPLKRYRIDTVNSSQAVSGTDRHHLRRQRGRLLPSGYQGNIRKLKLSPDENRMQFEFWYDDYGPTLFDLARVP